MNRRYALALLVLGAAAPLAGSQPHRERVRRIAVLLGYSESDTMAQTRFGAFKEKFAALGWEEGRNLQMEVRWTGGDVKQAAPLAKELVALKPEVILSNTTP